MSDWVIDCTTPTEFFYGDSPYYTTKGKALKVTEFLLNTVYTGLSKREQDVVGEAVKRFLDNLDMSLDNFYNDLYIELK